MSKSAIILGCLMPAALASIILEPGYCYFTKTFPEYVFQPISLVNSELTRRFPNWKIKIFPDDGMEYPSEFYYNQIKVVVNDVGIVVEPPVFAGSEPDLSFTTTLMNMKWEDAALEIRRRLPNISIVVKQRGKTLTVVVLSRRDHLVVYADERGRVSQTPVYVYSPPPETDY